MEYGRCVTIGTFFTFPLKKIAAVRARKIYAQFFEVKTDSAIIFSTSKYELRAELRPQFLNNLLKIDQALGTSQAVSGVA